MKSEARNAALTSNTMTFAALIAALISSFQRSPGRIEVSSDG